MILFIFSICNLYAIVLSVTESAVESEEIGIVFLSQGGAYHDKLLYRKEKDLWKQVEKLHPFQIQVFHSAELDDVGHWTIFPLIEKLSAFKKLRWVIFLGESTDVNLEKLFNVFKRYNSSEEVFVGYALQDNDPTIIHHFADSASLLYPHFAVGFFISIGLLERLVSRLPVDDEYSFSIDPQYEFSKFVWDNGNGVKLQHDSQFCLVKDKESCATWVKEEFPNCGLPLPSEKLHVGVKTCHKFHHDRITVVKGTWASEAKNLNIFSDKEDSSIPTIKVEVENVAHGHCEKTLSIMKYYVDKDIAFDWLAIVDDDSLISIKRLQKLLACYNASDNVALGERYGYGVSIGMGYNYITGGGGMIFSYRTINLLVRSCVCPSIDSPDDMIIGLCLQRLGIPVTHSPYFHQARPSDYSPDFLKPLKHISFHKHWMIDPYSVYREWLQDVTTADMHTEL